MNFVRFPNSPRRFALVLAIMAGRLAAADYHVATSGSDTSDGSFATPFRTIQRAANAAVAGDNVIIRAGIYRETVRPANSGNAGARITYKAYESAGIYEDVIISGADPVTGWTPHDTANGKAIYKSTAMTWNLSDTGASFGTSYRNQLFVNGEMQVLARWPNVPAERITRLTYNDLALVSAASGQVGSTSTSAWIENANVNATFPAGYWNSTRLATARVFLSPATMIWGMSVKIASQSANRLNLDATGSGFSFTSSYYYPTTNNRFYLYDWYEALDTVGEYWKDIATNTVYLWAPASANPSTLTVEARRRDFGLSLGSRSYLNFQGIKLHACTVDSDASSNSLAFSELEARYFAHIENLAPTFTTAANAREFYLRGDGHIVQDSYFYGSAVGGIGASGTNMRIENNVIRDFGYAHAGSAIFARNGGIYGNRTLASKNQFLHNTAFNGGHTIVTTDPALDVKYNRIYNSHLRGSDVGAVGIASTDGLGSEIAYNVISNANGPKDTGVLYGGFGIYFDYECRNYTVHHNIVYNTTASSYQLMPNRAANLPGVTNVGMKFYHNTGDGDFGIIEPQDVTGVDVRNNLIRKFGSAGGAYAGLPNVQFSNNTAYTTDAAAPFRDRSRGDLRFASGSSTGVNAGTVIPPYSDGFVSTSPDTGALEFDLAPFIAGATIIQRQLNSLTAANAAQTGSFIDLQLGNLPEGRSPTNTFQAQIGSEAFGGTLAYDYPTSTWRLLGVNKGALTGLQSVSVRLSGTGTAVTLDSQIDVGGGVPAPEIAVRGNSVNIADGDTTPSGTDHTTFADTQSGDPVGTAQTYTIFNFGSVALNMGAITFNGTNAADFSVSTAPASNVAAGATTTFTVVFKPTAIGLRTANVTIANNDADEANFDFVIQGQGTTPLPEINLPTPQLASTLTANSTGSVPLPIQNSGLANLTWSLSSSAAGLYSWADSTSGGPAYTWYEISSLGTKHWGGGYDDDDERTVNLPFTFPFYGSNFTQLKIGTNGILSPGVGSIVSSYVNYSLPSATAPANLIAAFWDDLIIDASAQIRSHAVNATTFVVLYENVKSIASSNRITFQVVIRADGQITIQYRDNQFTRSYTIGLQNGAKNLGPQIAYSIDTGNIQGLQIPVGTGINRALTFYPPMNFVTGFNPSSGTISAGSTSSPSVEISTAGLAAGSYQTTLTLASNDADEASVQIPVSLVVQSGGTASPPVIAAGQSATGTLGTAFNFTVVASNSPTGYAHVSGSLPPGVTLNTATGLLSGTPETSGIYTPAFTATNADGTSPAVTVTLNIGDGSLIMYEGFNHPAGTNSPDPDGGNNSNNGLPATNIGGTPSGTSTGLFGTWGTTLDVAAGLSYTQGIYQLANSGGSGAPNNATWGGGPSAYRLMATDPFLSHRIGGANNGAFGVNGQSLYLAVLAHTASATAQAWRLNLAGTGRNVFLENTATGWSLNENAAGPVATSAALALNTPTLLVVRIDFVAGAGDVFRLWVNPTLGTTPGTANATLTTSVDYGGFNGINPRPAVINAMKFDEFRMGTTFAAVTPFTEPPPVLPAAPSALAAATFSSSQINLTWTDNASNETGFKLERSPDGSNGWTQIATTAANTTSHADNGLATGTTCFYRLRATNANGDSAYTSTASATTWNAAENWRNTWFGTTSNTGNAADSADPDGDNVTNADEFTTGSDPLAPGAPASASASNVPARLVSLAPAADAYVDSSNPTANYPATDLIVRSETTIREAYLRYDLAALSGTVERAQLVFWPTAADSQTPVFNIEQIVDSADGWTETGLTWNNKPASLAANAASFTGPVSAGIPRVVDITAMVADTLAADAAKQLGLRLHATGSMPTQSASFGSKENGGSFRHAYLHITLRAAASEPLKILHAGDSITRGSAGAVGSNTFSNSGSRYYLHNLLLASGIDFRAVGPRQDGSISAFRLGSDGSNNSALLDRPLAFPANAGFSGQSIEYIRDNIAAWISNSPPDLITLMIGTNNVNYAQAPSVAATQTEINNWKSRYAALLDNILAASATAKVVMATITPAAGANAPNNSNRIEPFNAQVVQALFAQYSAAHPGRFFLVDHYAALTSADISGDNVHPTSLGHQKLARSWHAGVVAALGRNDEVRFINQSAGADAALRGGANASTAFGNATTPLVPGWTSSLLRAKSDPAADSRAKPLIKIDLTGLPGFIGTARLGFTYHGATPAGGLTAGATLLHLYGVNDGGDAWEKSSVTWNSAPGHNSATNGVLPGNVAYLASVTVPADARTGDLVTFSSSALAQFLGSQSDALASFVIIASGRQSQEVVLHASNQADYQPGFLLVTEAPSSLQAFRAANSLTTDGSQDLLTPAGDGVANLLKYAFNMLGTGTGQAASLGLPNTSSLIADGNAGLPLRGMDLNGRLQLTYIRRKPSSNPGINYTVQFSDTLGGWAVNPSANESTFTIDDTFQRVTVTDSSAGPQRFARILVTSP